MKFAQLDRYITVQTNTPAQDSLGEVVDGWTDFVSCFAQRTSRPGREYFQASKVTNESLFYYLIRHNEGITAQMQIVDGTKTYQITDVMYSEKRNESMQLACKEVV